MLLAVYLHRLDPFAIRITEGFGIRWYGLSYVAGFFAAYLLLVSLAKRRRLLIGPEKVGDYVLAIAVGTIVGGRLGYCVFYRPDLLTQFTSDLPFWGVLAINQGGMASHGGIIGIILACIYFARRHRVPRLHATDLVGLTGTIGIFFGRLANFVNGELYGRVCSDHVKWAVKFPQEILNWTDPASPYGPRLDSPGFAKVTQLVRELPASWFPDGAGIYEKITIAAQRQDDVAAALAPLLNPRHPSQIYQALLEGLLLFVVVFWIWRKPRKPGLVSGWFLVGYAVMRIIGEQFRMPDAHIGYEPLGLTRGQWLSVAMLVVGIACLVTWSRRRVEAIGGWGGTGPAETPT